MTTTPKPLGDLDLTKLTPRAGELSAYQVSLGGVVIGRVAQHEQASYREIKGSRLRGSLRGYYRYWVAHRQGEPERYIRYGPARRKDAVEELVIAATKKELMEEAGNRVR